MNLVLAPATGSPDYEDVLWDGTRVPGSWAAGLSQAEIEAAANAPFTFNRFGQNVPLASVSGIERFFLSNPNVMTWLLVALVLLLVLGVGKR